MPDSDLPFMSATQAAAAIRQGELSPVAYAEAILARAASVQAALNPFAELCAERAMAQARDAEKALARGEALGSLHGVPVHVKDLFRTAGVPTRLGSAIYADNIPDRDDVLVTRLKAAGAIIFAKTTTPEFGHKGQTDGPSFGVTRNPWSPDRGAGGSSGGAAVAVAAGAGPLGLGTDGAGSIRIPSAYCGIVGLKPTSGLVPFEDAIDGFFSYAAAGPMTRTIADAALMLGVLAGAHAPDPWSLAAPPLGRIDPVLSGGSLHGVRIGWFPRMANEHVAADVRANAEATITALAARGARVKEVTESIDWIEYPGRIMYQANIAVAFGHYVETWRDRMDPVLLAFIERGSAFTLADYRKAQYARTRLYRAVQGLFERYDFLLSPSLARTALPADFDVANGVVEVDGKPNGNTRQGMSPYVYPFNLTGHPALSVPSGFGDDGLPTGVQIVGRWHADLDVLRIGAVLEEDRPWAQHRPRLATE